MRVFVTGASGWIGSAVVPELLAAGHQVLGLARSDASAARVEELGADVHRGDLDDLDSLRSGAASCEGVVHLGYHHDFSQMAEAAALDLAAIDVFGDVLAGTDGPLLIASGMLGLPSDPPATEEFRPDPASHPRMANAIHTLDLADRGVRSCVVRFAPTVHGHGDRGFIATLVELAGRSGFAGYVEDGTNRWPAVHRLDAAALVRRGVESAPAGSSLHAAGETGIPTIEIAEAIGRAVGVPARSVPTADVDAHFGWIGGFFGSDCPVSNDWTRQTLDWAPTHPGLVADLDAGAYAGVTPHSTTG